MLFKYKSAKHFIMLFFAFCFISCATIFEDSPLTLLKEAYNHKKTKKAMVFMNGGNATTDNSLHVVLENADFELTDAKLGNVFIVDSNHNAVKLDSSAINLTWLSEKTLEISFLSKLRTFKKANEMDGVKIVYKEL
ncbi:hypothetical protein ASU31_22025 [Pedobacter ginsenosidimutans]|uniref:Auto-transporter adhesin head GIN domain-containing protein n=2 Tax=Pedobacter ginsenosidimutans TaxID=687842 RepID=A0A0T5VJ91_9SPHI|nr:hypothetical protein ASU31_22025 [Pedobacter ginsenosidimutans]